MKNKHNHSHEDCDCEHHNTELNEDEHTHSCPTSKMVENLLKSLDIEDEKEKD